jgi:hypothetical protein
MRAVPAGRAIPLAASLLLAVAVGGCSPAESEAQRDLDNCGPVSADDAKTIAWLAELRRQGKLPIDEPRAGHCDSGTRAAVGATVESGGSRQVDEFFSTKECNIKIEIANPCEVKDGSDLYSVWLWKDQGWTLLAGLNSN